MKCFAYGSNMCRSRILERVPGARFEAVARLPAHALRFHKRSVDGSAKADALFTGDPADEVWGVIIDLPDEQRRALDSAEGLGSGYLDLDFTAYDRNGAQYRTIAYIAEDSYIDPRLRPYDWYLELVVKGAHARGLPDAYVAGIDMIEAVPDVEEGRPGRPDGALAC